MPVSTLGRSVLTVGCSAVYMYHVYSNMPEERQAAIQEAGWKTVDYSPTTLTAAPSAS